MRIRILKQYVASTHWQSRPIHDLCCEIGSNERSGHRNTEDVGCLGERNRRMNHERVAAWSINTPKPVNTASTVYLKARYNATPGGREGDTSQQAHPAITIRHDNS